VKKLIVALLIGIFALAGGEKIFGFEKSAQAKIVLGGAEMHQNHFSLMKGFVHEAITKDKFTDGMKAKCAEMLVWITQKLMDKKHHDLTKTTDDLSRLFRAVVVDINSFFANSKKTQKEKMKIAEKWVGNGKRLIVKFVRITIKSKTTGGSITKIDWKITLPKIIKPKVKKKK